MCDSVQPLYLDCAKVGGPVLFRAAVLQLLPQKRAASLYKKPWTSQAGLIQLVQVRMSRAVTF